MWNARSNTLTATLSVPNAQEIEVPKGRPPGPKRAIIPELHGRHPRLNPAHPAAHPVMCPTCGLLEFWTEWEVNNHGLCRHREDLVCPTCGEMVDGKLPG